MDYKRYYINLIKTQLKIELLKLWRMPVYIITLTGLPLFFYLATGTNHKMPEITEGLPTTQYLVCTLGTFGVFGIALFGFGVSFSIERSQGWYYTLQTAPIPIWIIFLSKLFAFFILSAFAILMLFGEAAWLFSVSMPFGSWWGIFFTLLLGSLPLATLGLLIGSLSGSNSVSLITIMVYLAVASVSGLLATLSMIRAGNPRMADMAVIYPTYHVYQLALSNIQYKSIGEILKHIAFLSGYFIGFGGLTLLLLKRNMHKSFG